MSYIWSYMKLALEIPISSTFSDSNWLYLPLNATFVTISQHGEIMFRLISLDCELKSASSLDSHKNIWF